MAVGTETGSIIVRDVALGIPPAASQLEYTDEMREFRAEVEREWAEWKKTHPDATLWVPGDD